MSEDRAKHVPAATDARFRALVENSLDGIALLRRDATAFYTTPSVTRILGYPPEEFLDRSVLDFIHREDVERWQRLFARAVEQPGAPIAAEIRCRHRDGSWKFVEVVAVNRFDDPAVGALVANYRDVTARREVEDELRGSRERLRKLSSRLSTVAEEERARIAREVHDEFGQKLTGLQMGISRLRAGLPRDAAIQQSAGSLLALIDDLFRTVRAIATSLRPAVLDQLGLPSAIQWQAREFERLTGIECHVVTRLEQPRLDFARSTALFRGLQEALTNVARHARATRVQAQLRTEAGNLLLEISDNGQGTTEKELTRPDSLGLLGMRERIEEVGGTVQITSAPGKGTRLRLRVPLKGAVGTDGEEDPDRR